MRHYVLTSPLRGFLDLATLWNVQIVQIQPFFKENQPPKTRQLLNISLVDSFMPGRAFAEPRSNHFPHPQAGPAS